MDGPRELLQADLATTRARLAALTADFDAVVAASQDSNADDEHDPEGATIAFERSQISALVLQTRSHEAQVIAALLRLEEGTYGTCVGCAGPIAPARLQARPFASSCITCAHLG